MAEKTPDRNKKTVKRTRSTLLPISGVLATLGQKVHRICRSCGKDFECTNLGPMTAQNCPDCAEIHIKAQQKIEDDRIALEKETAYRKLIYYAQIPGKWGDTTFETSDPKLNKIHHAAFKFARSYAEGFTTKSPSVIFYSPGPGTGKTHLAMCIANHVLHQKRTSVVFKKARDLMLEIRSTYSDQEGDKETEASILKRVLSASLLVLDDVGVDPPTRWQQSTYWTIFDRRLDYQLPIIITTNKIIEGKGETLENIIGDRAYSRLIELSEKNVIDMTGPDLRWQMKK
jgi:DNA replication protein DnaC